MATRAQVVQGASPETATEDAVEIARRWDAGEAGCGVLIVGLKREIRRIESGEFLQVTALGAGAAADLAAWCRLTGHALVAADHPRYVVRKKDDGFNQHSNAGGQRNG